MSGKPRSPKQWLSHLNSKHAVVRESGKTRVITEELDPVLGRKYLTRSTFGDIRKFYNEPINGEQDRVGAWWLDHKERRQYDSVVFAPGKEVENSYNLWRGWAFDPVKGDWARLRDHIHEVICAADDDLFKWLMAWMAAGVQQPGTQAQVSIVLRGERGAGKGLTINEYGRAFGQHFLQVTHPRHLTGNFNSHLQDCVVLFADEAFWTADRSAQSILKTLITEPTIVIEPKGRDVFQVKKSLHILMAGNDDHIVPAGIDERRFCVLDVSSSHKQDHNYFAQLIAQQENGGRAAMLYDLLQYDYSAINLRQAPATEALRQQKVLSLTPRERWLYESFMRGTIAGTSIVDGATIRKSAVHEDQAESIKSAGDWRVPASTETELGMFLKRVFHGSLQSARPSMGGVRPWCWVFPPLAECRAWFDAYTNSEHPWEEPGEQSLVSDMPHPRAYSGGKGWQR